VSRYQKGKTNLDFTEARDSEWQWHQLGYMQVYTLLQTDNHANTSPLCFIQAGYPSCHPRPNQQCQSTEGITKYHHHHHHLYAQYAEMNSKICNVLDKKANSFSSNNCP